MSPDPAVLSSYNSWLFAMARKYSSDINEHDDIAAEGRIAMWRALSTFDPGKGSLPSWLTGAAMMRMSEVSRRKTWTGTPMRKGHTREKPAVPADPDKIRPSVSVIPDSADLAYHRAEIFAALASLPPGARTALYKRFWLDESVSANTWKRYLPALAERLSELRGMG